MLTMLKLSFEFYNKCKQGHRFVLSTTNTHSHKRSIRILESKIINLVSQPNINSGTKVEQRIWHLWSKISYDTQNGQSFLSIYINISKGLNSFSLSSRWHNKWINEIYYEWYCCFFCLKEHDELECLGISLNDVEVCSAVTYFLRE